MKIFKYFSILVGMILLFSINVFALHRFSPLYRGHGMMWGGEELLICLTFFFLIGLAIYFVVKNIREKKSDILASGREETPLEIIKRRYAKGEINQEEFQNIRKELQS